MKSLKYGMWLSLTFTTAISATPLIHETETPYQISGNSARQLRIAINQATASEQEVRYDAHTSWYVKWNFDYQSIDNLCHLTKTTVTLDISYRLPEWIDRNNASPELQAKWDNYLKLLRIHEQGHAENGKQAAIEIEAMLSELPSMENCQQLNALANKKAYQIISKYNDKDSQYDTDTAHGATQGASF